MRIRLIIVFIGFITHWSVSAQRKIEPTDSFKIQGKIKSEKVFTLTQLDSFPKQVLKDQMIYNHKGEIKDTVKNSKGILLKTVLAKIEFSYEKPKELNEFYFVFIASDGYKVVFSWNEIYNTAIGDNLFIITEHEGKKLKDMEQRIVLSSTADLKNGRRYVKALERIEVKRIE
ncbi:molybdopterin-binding protein [Flavobacterium sp.]|uniref:molybdopterin-binding protein n=1 Tax=Flavobacterium sp. TaxID=239 RepID=UPI00286AC736|nr:molybdopterin-binding protein [Flavobacterium sp.]